MNVYCVKDNTLMVQHGDEYTCLKCEGRVKLEFIPEGACCEDGMHDNITVPCKICRKEKASIGDGYCIQCYKEKNT